MPVDEDELAYYRAVEDLFAALRGVPHVLSPADFQLLRQWWRDEIPLAAIRCGITEVFARHADRQPAEPIVSLRYCRHAVQAHARRIAEMAVGGHPGLPHQEDRHASLQSLAARLVAAADSFRSSQSTVAEVILSVASEIEAAADLPMPQLEEHLFALETTLLAACRRTVDRSLLTRIAETSKREASAIAGGAEARERARRALEDRLLRAELGLPRLELDQ